MMKKLCSIILFVLLALPVSSNADFGNGLYGPCGPMLRMTFPELLVDGPVNKMAIAGNYLFVGGSFNTVGFFTGKITALNRKTGNPIISQEWPHTNNLTNIIAGPGKMRYLFGSFTKIPLAKFWLTGDTIRSYLAALDSDNFITPFRPIVNGPINAALIYNNILYIGGYFTTVNGQPRNHLAAIDLVTETLTGWNPNVQNTVVGTLPCRIECMIAYNGQIYVGGAFNKIGTVGRKNIAAIDAGTGLATSWAPEAYYASAPNYGAVTKMLQHGNGLYFCGSFDYTAGQSRNNLALVNINTGVADNWRPDPDIAAYALSARGDTLYVGGNFLQISGQTRHALAAYNMNSVNIDLLPLSITMARTGDAIKDILASNDTLYIGGSFDTVNGAFRRNMAAVHTTTGALRPWKSHSDGEVASINILGGRLYAGGLFSSIGRKERQNLFQLDADADTVMPWLPKVDGPIKNIVAGKHVVYIGGDFTKVNDSARQFNAALDINTAAVTKWNPQLNIILNDVKEYKNDIYLAGSFTSIKGQPRNGLAKTDTANNVLPWIGLTQPGTVAAMSIHDQQLYIGGHFTEVTGKPRKNIGVIDLASGQATPEIQDDTFSVKLIDKDDTGLYFIDSGNYHYSRPTRTGVLKKDSSLYPIKAMTRLYSEVDDTNKWREPIFAGENYCNMQTSQTLYPQYNGIYANLFSISTINTMALYGNKLYMGGDPFLDPVLGILSTALFTIPTIDKRATLYTDTNALCAGTSSMIRVRSFNSYNVQYQWNVNGVDINNPHPYYFSIPADKDSISCVLLIPPSGCYAPTTDTTDVIRYRVFPVSAPQISIAGPTEADSGVQLLIKATITNVISGYTIEWFNKGLSMGKTTLDYLNYTKGSGTDSIYAIVTPTTDTCFKSDTSALIVINEKPEGISNIDGDNGIAVYPNPFNKLVRIRGLQVGDIIMLYDITGRKVMADEYHAQTKEYTIVSRYLKTGTYVLKITDRNGTSRKNILIQKQE